MSERTKRVLLDLESSFWIPAEFRSDFMDCLSTPRNPERERERRASADQLDIGPEHQRFRSRLPSKWSRAFENHEWRSTGITRSLQVVLATGRL